MGYVERFANPNTRRAYARDIAVWESFVNGREADEDTVVAFRSYLVSRFAPAGAARVWATVRGYVAGTPLADAFSMQAPKRIVNQAPYVPSDEDVDALVAAAADNPQRALIIALLLNGLRAGEVSALASSGVERQQGATILRLVGKGGKERLVPATSEVERTLTRYRATATEAQVASPYLVSDYDGSRLTVRQVQHAVYKTAEYAGVEKMHAHSLRHHYATRLIRAGASVLHVQPLLGHATVATTQRYVHLDLTDLIAASARDPRNQPTRPEVVAA